MKLTDEQIAAIRDGTEGVTPGPWAWGKRWYSGYQIGTLTGETPVLDLGGAGVSVIAAAHIARCDPDTIRALATEVLESRAVLAEHEADKEQSHQEGYDEGYREGQSDAAGAQSDFWRMMLRYFDKHGIEPASDDGEGYSAHQMMDALHEHESEVDAAHQAEIARRTIERDAAIYALGEWVRKAGAAEVRVAKLATQPLAEGCWLNQPGCSGNCGNYGCGG